MCTFRAVTLELNRCLMLKIEDLLRTGMWQIKNMILFLFL
jgi:hypothetical protein